jgi:hypothetical protein
MTIDRHRRRLAILAAISAALLLAAFAPAADAGWKTQSLEFVPRYPGDAEPGAFLAISCPSASLCVAGGEYERIATSSNPTGGAAAWKVFRGPEGSDYSGPPPPPGAPPNVQTPHIKGVACPSPGLCVAVSANGDVYTSRSPLGGAAAWARTDVDGDEYDTHLEAVSCPTSSFCLAVSGGAKSHANPRTSGKVLFSHDPTGGAAAWHVIQLDPEYDLRGLSCATPSLCLAVGRDGLMLVSTDPDGGPSAWRPLGAPGGPGHLQGVDCVSGLCAAGNTGGNILTNPDPASGGAWLERSGGASVGITGISCPAANRCLAVDNNGDVITSTEPTGGAGAWQIENVLPYVPKPGYEPTLNGMFAVSCPSVGFCAIAAADGTVLTNTDPFATAAPTSPRRKKRRRAKRPRTIIARVDRGGLVRTDRARLRVLFRFYSKGSPRKFLCRHDGGRWRSCRSPHRYWARHGRHVFRVRAVGYTGLRGPIASARFRVHDTDDKCPC